MISSSKRKLFFPIFALLLAAIGWGISIPIMKVLNSEQIFLAPSLFSNSLEGPEGSERSDESEGTTGSEGSISQNPQITICLAALSLALRFGLAAFGIALLARISLWKISFFEWKQGSILGLITAVSMGIQVDGLNYTSASTAGFLIALYSVFIPIWFWISGKRKMTFMLFLACIFVLIGMGILTGFHAQNFSFGRGEWESLGAAVLFALQIIWIGSLDPKSYKPNILTFVLCITVAFFCALALLAIIFFQKTFSFDQILSTQYSFHSIFLTLSLAIIGTALPFLIMNRYQNQISATTAGFLYCFEPIATALGALFLPELLGRSGSTYLNESFSFNLGLGGFFILAANLMVLKANPTKD